MTSPVGSGGESLAKTLGKKLGPLPVGGWLVVAGVAIGGFMLYTRSGAGDVRGSEGIGVDTGVPSGVATGPGTPGFIPVSPSAPEPTETNEQWSVKAIGYLTPTYGAVKSTQAIARYLNGEQLAAEDVTIIDAAVKALGPPPVPPQSVIQPPTGTPDTGLGSPDYGWTKSADRKPEYGAYHRAGKDNTYGAYFNQIYENRPQDKSKEWWTMVSWFRFVNGNTGSVKKGQVLKLPGHIYLYRPPL